MNLGVAVRSERVTLTLKLAAQLGIVVDLAVLHDDARSVLAHDWLVAAGKVDDGEATRRKRNGTVDVFAAAIRPAMHERCAHGRQSLGVGHTRSRRNPTDPAHAAESMERGLAAIA